MNGDTILRVKNYYYGKIDPRLYYKNERGDVITRKAIQNRNQYRDVYLSDLLNNPECGVTIEKYRDKDDLNAPVKTSGWNDLKYGTVIGYNPVTNMVAVDCIKRRPSRISALFNRTKKIRYADPIHINVLLGRACLLKPTDLTPKAPHGSPKGRSTPKGSKSPKGSTPKGSRSPRGTSKGGKTRKHKH